MTDQRIGQGIGATVLRNEDDRFLNGRGQYLGDISVPGFQEVLLVFLGDRPQKKEHPDDFLSGPVPERFEQFKGLSFVLHQRIALSVTPQTDSFLEMVQNQ